MIRDHATRWQRAALGAILALAAFLRFYRLAREGFANLYYAAGVQSMLTGWRPFFFASFDPLCFVSIDKPPLGLWVQAASVALLGFDGWALLLPQALAGVLSVALVYGLARRAFGPAAGLAAALALAVTPISVAANRNNTQDSVLVCMLLLATWALFRATERGRPGWLLAALALVGLGFNIKMMQAYMVLPAFVLLYALGAPVRWWKRALHLALAGLLMLGLSLGWAAAVDLTPAAERPYVGSSASNSVLELMIGHNGLTRLLGAGAKQGAAPPGPGRQGPGSAPGSPPAGGPPPGGALSNETGAPGILRLFNRPLAGQVMWLLPLALLGVPAMLGRDRVRLPLTGRHQAVLFWLAWLLPQMAFFSFASLFHRYYLEMLAPALAVLSGAGLAAMGRDWVERKGRGWLLPAALAATAALQAAIVWPFADYRAGLVPAIVLGCGIAVLALIAARRSSQPSGRAVGRAAAGLGLLVLLIGPTVWSWIPVWHGGDGWLPFAGPDVLVERRVAPAQEGNERLVAFLQARHRQEDWLLAALNARDAAPIMLAARQPVMAIGGFSGSDPIVSPQELQAMARAGEVRFFLLVGDGPQHPAVQWVSGQCRPVPPREWGGAPGGQGLSLWDCGP